ncbi:MAG TPA: NMD3-related protein [archaeon]|nr:NMD3-related protein [archaeon]
MTSFKRGLFCPRCGKTEEQARFIGGFCRECWVHDHPQALAVPKVLEVVSCPRCDRIQLEGRWEKNEGDAFAQAALSKAKPSQDFKVLRLDLQTSRGARGAETATIKAIGAVEGVRVEVEKGAELRRLKSVCESCSKAAGSYFEAVIQVRFEGKPGAQGLKVLRQVDRELDSLRDSGVELAQVTKFAERKNGFDAFIGNRQAARHVAELLAKKHDSKITQSQTLAGEKEGKQLYRMTYCVRI